MTVEARPLRGAREPRPRLAYILRSFPRLSQTFVLNEILALERLGHDVRIFGMVAARDAIAHAAVGDVRGPVEFLDVALERPRRALVRDQLVLLRRHPLRYLRTATYLARHRALVGGYTTTTPASSFLQAAYVAARLARDHVVDHIHSHFAHDPTLIAMLVSKMTGVTYSFTAHARDIYQVPQRALEERIRHSSAVITVCQANVDHLRRMAPNGGGAKVRLVHTGIDVDAFRPARTGAPTAPPLVAVVSRLVEKKGLLDLVAALGRVKGRGRAFRAIVVGEGPLRSDVEAALAGAGLADDVRLAGAATQAEVGRVLQSADVFVLTPFVTRDGDRDGLPTSILEAMSCGLPVVATRVAGIPEAVVHGETGLLARPRDVAGIAAHIEALLDDAELRRRLGANARAAIAERWSAPAVAHQLASLFDGVARGGV